VRRGAGLPAAIAALCWGLTGCAGAGAPPPASVRPAVALQAYVVVDEDFTRRFGDRRGPGRTAVNNWLWETERQMQTQFPVSLKLAGLGSWTLPAGALDGQRIFAKYVPQVWPTGTRANCLIALTGRKAVYWSGVSQWPRLFVKVQAAEPVNAKTVAVLCHEISHWFGAVDIVDGRFPERSVMNYKDARFGMVGGRVTWDQANRRRMLKTMATWGAR